MTTDEKIRDEEIQYDINKEEGKISALSSIKIDKYKYLTSEEVLPSYRKQIIEQATFAYSLLGKPFEKPSEKQVGAIRTLKLSNKKDELKQIEGLFPQTLMNNLIFLKLKKIINLHDIIKTDKLYYKSKHRKVL